MDAGFLGTAPPQPCAYAKDVGGNAMKSQRKKRKNLKAAAHNQDPTRPDDAKCFGAF